MSLLNNISVLIIRMKEQDSKKKFVPCLRMRGVRRWLRGRRIIRDLRSHSYSTASSNKVVRPTKQTALHQKCRSSVQDREAQSPRKA